MAEKSSDSASPDKKVVQLSTKENVPYKIENIVDSRKGEDGKTQYKVRCIIYNWLNEEDLCEYPQLLKKFSSLQKKQLSKPSKGMKRKAKDSELKTQEIESKAEDTTEEQKNPENVLNEMKVTSSPEDVSKQVQEKSLPKRSKRLKENDERLSTFLCRRCDKSFRNEDIFTAHMLEHEQDGDLITEGDLINNIIQVTVIGKKKEYKCLLCSRRLREKRDAIVHQRMHSGTNPWYCQECDKHFLRKYKYTRHILVHAGTKNFVCNACGKKFNGADYLKRHQMTFCSADKGRFKCDICEQIFGEKRLLDAHVGIHNGTNPFYCVMCERYFLKKNLYENHMIQHDEYRPYKCSTCSKRFTAKGDFNRHVKSHDDDLYVCYTCKEVYNLQEDLEMHYQMSENCLEVICTECNVEFPCVSDLRSHLQSYAVSSNPTDPGAAVYICRFCQRGFHVYTAYIQHRPVHVCEKPRNCIHCDTNFPNREKLTTHIKSVHGIATTYPCVQCGKVFDESSSLRRHTKSSHGKEAVYRCLPCEKLFYTRSDLNRHQLTKQHLKLINDDGTGKFDKNSKLHCAICEKVFQNLNELKRHEFLHQRVQVNPEHELVFDDTVMDAPASPAYFDAGVYDIEGGEQIILSEGAFMGAKLNIDSSGNIGLLYINSTEDEPTNIVSSNVDISSNAEPLSVTSSDDIINNASRENRYSQFPTEEVSIEQRTSTDDPRPLLQTPQVSEENIITGIASTSATMVNNIAISSAMEACNEETFLVLSEMVQQGKIDVSSLQAIQSTVDSTTEE